MSSKARYFLAGFGIGSVLSLLWNVTPIIRAGSAPSIPGVWADIAVQAVVVGMLTGLVALLYASLRRR